jgi:large subunit ribosomal protein L21
MHAVIETGGKQYRVTVGDRIEVEKLGLQAGSNVKFPVLLIEEGSDLKIGRPTLQGAEVVGEILAQEKGPKVISYIFRRRKGSERKVGHRQPLTVVKITDIKGV